jgi:hypothetical protein
MRGINQLGIRALVEQRAPDNGWLSSDAFEKR